MANPNPSYCSASQKATLPTPSLNKTIATAEIKLANNIYQNAFLNFKKPKFILRIDSKMLAEIINNAPMYCFSSNLSPKTKKLNVITNIGVNWNKGTTLDASSKESALKYGSKKTDVRNPDPINIKIDEKVIACKP